MRFLLSTIGSRGEVQPVVALAMELTARGQEVVVCAPPDFRAWAESWGIAYVPVGPELRGTAKQSAGAVPTPEQRRQMIEGTMAAQFAAVRGAAEGCDVIVGGGALAVAAHSVAEHRGIGYVHAAFAPITLPSAHHAPPVFGMLGQKPADGPVDHRRLWAEDAERWNTLWGAALGAQRGALGLPPLKDVRGHLFTDRPWLAADPTLAPWPRPSDLDVLQTGAWVLADNRPLAPELETFLDAGEPPVYCGFGSARAPENIAMTVIATARALGRRVILSSGWAGLTPVDDEPDCLSIGEVNQRALFPRVAAVVHHGGAGTTTAAAAAGTPQVVVPRMFDQFYFAHRVEHLGIGSAHPSSPPTGDSLLAALRHALDPEVSRRAGTIAGEVRADGAATAARRLIDMR
ncbi:glycosyltransferase [Streptomyces sp. LX-29]|uniref:glycosyltransferase n=1 Tax=Streptomyces sp. LX-29 TaxID=2900152 RepID=UPI00240CFBFD|nr:glycosyltransferase [Streptomyces sp. LX-29]WFB05891.1 glycosyltransferase [Streptomyces sp. LX-29]